MQINRRQFIATPLIGVAASCVTACDPLPFQNNHVNNSSIIGGYAHETVQIGHFLRDFKGKLPISKRITRTRCIIAGAGVAGLSAARQLTHLNQSDFIVLELADKAGGNAKSASINGILHPLGAHYLPIPNPSMSELQGFLEELNICQRQSGRWVYDEQFLCHSPQERLFFKGQWQTGLLPLQGVSDATLTQYQRFSHLIAMWRDTRQFHIPNTCTLNWATKSGSTQYNDLLNLYSLTFGQYLFKNGFNDLHLLWYLDYCCRDEYGSGLNTVSAWAGIHYFAARHGFNNAANNDEDSLPVLTWPQGNAFLTQALSALLGERVYTHRIIMQIEVLRNRVVIDTINLLTHQVERYEALQAIIALPAMLVSKILINPSQTLLDRINNIQYSAWSVANIACHTPLQIDDRTAGNAPYMAWDNVIYPINTFSFNAHLSSLGYVNATHQYLSPSHATVLTHYSAYGSSLAAKKALLALTWQQARDQILQELSYVHRDIYQQVSRVDITRYGHAMATPVPITHQLTHHLSQPSMARLQFAHSDWAGYSIFEEAFYQGIHAANRLNSAR